MLVALRKQDKNEQKVKDSYSANTSMKQKKKLNIIQYDVQPKLQNAFHCRHKLF